MSVSQNLLAWAVLKKAADVEVNAEEPGSTPIEVPDEIGAGLQED